LSGTTWVSRYQKGKTNLDFTGARDSEWHWHQLGHMQVCTSLQTDNHASTPPLRFFTGRMPFLPPNQQRQSIEGKTGPYEKLWKLLSEQVREYGQYRIAMWRSCQEERRDAFTQRLSYATRLKLRNSYLKVTFRNILILQATYEILMLEWWGRVAYL